MTLHPDRGIGLACKNDVMKTAAIAVAILVLLSTSLISFPMMVDATNPASKATFGNMLRGSYTDYLYNFKDASRFQLTEQGTLQSVSVYFESSGFDAKVAVYGDSSAAPSDLVAQSGSAYVSATGWQVFSLPPTVLSAGYYWFTIVSDGADAQVSISYSGSSAQHCVGFSFGYNYEFASSFGSVMWYGAASVSIYATYVPAALASSTPSPIQTAITTPTPTRTPTPTSTPIPSATPIATPSPTHTPTVAPTQTPSAPATTNPASAATFGNKNRGGYAYILSDYKDATRFQLTEQGTLQSLSVYFESSSFAAKVAIYSDSAGRPSDLLAQSGSKYISATGWQAFSMPQITLSTGYYWLSIVSDDANAQVSITYSGLSMQHCVGFSFGYNYEFAGSFGSVMWYGSASVSMYATYVPLLTLSSVVTPTPTPTATSTPTPTPIDPPTVILTITPTPIPTSTATSQTTLGIFSDQACSTKLSNIAWGTLTPGGTTTLVLYAKNQGSTPITLTKTMTNVNPTNAANYLTLNWDYSDQSISPNGIMKLTLSLAVSSNVQAISNFSFDTVITATG